MQYKLNSISRIYEIKNHTATNAPAKTSNTSKQVKDKANCALKAERNRQKLAKAAEREKTAQQDLGKGRFVWGFKNILFLQNQSD